MRAAVLNSFGLPLSLEERPEPQDDHDRVIVRVRGAGVCHTDVHLAAARWPELRLPLVPGHEIAGEVAGVGPVLVYASWRCRECHFCLAGEEQLCPAATEAGWTADGPVGSNETLALAAATSHPTAASCRSGRKREPFNLHLDAPRGGELRWEVETLPLDDVNAALNRVREVSASFSCRSGHQRRLPTDARRA